jgi:hypothetical protein
VEKGWGKGGVAVVYIILNVCSKSMWFPVTTEKLHRQNLF